MYRISVVVKFLLFDHPHQWTKAKPYSEQYIYTSVVGCFFDFPFLITTRNSAQGELFTYRVMIALKNSELGYRSVAF